jgi:hypothetical protein
LSRLKPTRVVVPIEEEKVLYGVEILKNFPFIPAVANI